VPLNLAPAQAQRRGKQAAEKDAQEQQQQQQQEGQHVNFFRELEEGKSSQGKNAEAVAEKKAGIVAWEKKVGILKCLDEGAQAKSWYERKPAVVEGPELRRVNDPLDFMQKKLAEKRKHHRQERPAAPLDRYSASSSASAVHIPRGEVHRGMAAASAASVRKRGHEDSADEEDEEAERRRQKKARRKERRRREGSEEQERRQEKEQRRRQRKEGREEVRKERNRSRSDKYSERRRDREGKIGSLPSSTSSDSSASEDKRNPPRPQHSVEELREERLKREGAERRRAERLYMS
jgi:hypothetical protein